MQTQVLYLMYNRYRSSLANSRSSPTFGTKTLEAKLQDLEVDEGSER